MLLVDLELKAIANYIKMQDKLLNDLREENKELRMEVETLEWEKQKLEDRFNFLINESEEVENE